MQAQAYKRGLKWNLQKPRKLQDLQDPNPKQISKILKCILLLLT